MLQLLQVKQRKRKQPPKKQESTKPHPPKYPPMFGLKHYLPDKDIAEDPVTIQVHLQWLVVEDKKKRPDFKEVTRQDIVIKKLPTTALKEKYPWLFKPEADEVCII